MANILNSCISYRNLAGLSIVALFNLFILLSVASADQIKALDKQGNTLSMLNLQDGSLAKLRISLKGEGTSNAEVVLLDSVSKTQKYSALSDTTGVVQFDGVGAGTYIVEVRNSKALILAVDLEQIGAGTAAAVTGTNSALLSTQALYAGGGLAVVGAAGAAAGIISNNVSTSNNEMSPS